MKMAIFFMIFLVLTAFLTPVMVNLVNNIVLPALTGIHNFIASHIPISILDGGGDPIDTPAHPT